VGDYYRYASEATTMEVEPMPGDKTGEEKKEIFKKGALEAYKKCTNIVKRGLKPYNTVRLGLALNYSVF